MFDLTVVLLLASPFVAVIFTLIGVQTYFSWQARNFRPKIYIKPPELPSNVYDFESFRFRAFRKQQEQKYKSK